MSSPERRECKDFEDLLLPDRVGGADLGAPIADPSDVGASEREGLRDHLASCDSCRRVLEARRGLARELASISRIRPLTEGHGVPDHGGLSSFRATLAAVQEREALEQRWAPILRDQRRLSAPESLWARVVTALGLDGSSAARRTVAGGGGRILRLRRVASIAAALLLLGSIAAVVQLTRPGHHRPGGFSGTFGEPLISDGLRVNVEEASGPSGLTMPVRGRFGWRPMAEEGP